MADDVKLCMIGAGAHSSSNIYPYLHYLKGVRVLANADLDENRARSIAGKFGLPASYADYRKMIDAERPDGVIVCVSHTFNEKAAPEIMQAGCHVYTEKPTTGSLDGARRLLEASRKTGKLCMTAYKKRFAPAYMKAKAVVAREDFGKPILLTLVRTKGYNPAADPKSEYMLVWGCHGIDLLPYYFGPVQSVCALRTPGSTHGYGISVAFKNGAVGTVSITQCHGGTWEILRAFGSNMRSVVVENSINMTEYNREQPVSCHQPSFSMGATHGAIEQGFVGELQEFANAIREKRQPDANIEQAAHTMAVYEAIQRSAETGRTTDVEEVG